MTKWYSPGEIPNSAIEAFMRAEDDENLAVITWPSIGLWEEYGVPQDDAIVIAGAKRVQ